MANFIKDIGNEFVTVYHALSTKFCSKKKSEEIIGENLDKVKKGEIKLTILLHGMFANYHKSMYPTVKLLKKYGVDVVSLGYEYNNFLGKSAKKIKGDVDRLMRQTGAKRIDLIGLCSGGAVARYYIEELGGKKHVDNLVTVYSPLRPVPSNESGYKLNKLLGGNPEKYNPGLHRMENKSSVKNHLLIYSIDDKIILPKYSIMKEANQKKLNGGHLFLSYNPKVLKTVAEFLKRNKK